MRKGATALELAGVVHLEVLVGVVAHAWHELAEELLDHVGLRWPVITTHASNVADLVHALLDASSRAVRTDRGGGAAGTGEEACILHACVGVHHHLTGVQRLVRMASTACTHEGGHAAVSEALVATGGEQLLVDVAGWLVQDIAEGLLRAEAAVLVDAFLHRVELEAILEDEVLEDHADAEAVLVQLGVVERQGVELLELVEVVVLLLEQGQDHLHETVGAEPARERLVEILQAQELLEDERENFDFGILFQPSFDIFTALKAQVLRDFGMLGGACVTSSGLLGLVQRDVDVQFFRLLVLHQVTGVHLEGLASISFLLLLPLAEFNQIYFELDDGDRRRVDERVALQGKDGVQCLVQHLHLLYKLQAAELVDPRLRLVEEVVDEDVEVAGVDGQACRH